MPNGEQLRKTAEIRGCLPFRLQQSVGAQQRTVQEEGEAPRLRGPLCSIAEVENRVRVAL